LIVDDCADTAAIAHDLRNLLQVAGSALFQVDRLLDSATRARVRPYESAAAEALARAGVLSRALTRPQPNSGSVTLEPISIEVALLAIKPLIELAAGPAVRVAFHIASEVPAIACSCRELECVILNLVANARDAMPGGGAIDISIWRERADAILYVQDNGGGMSVETVAEAFRPYFTTKASLGGTGLGLAMVKRFAEQAGGQAEIDSAPGAGTTVILRLPGIANG
jgi:signal transduction histidine kinase